jgi:virginiamycin B lyase
MPLGGLLRGLVGGLIALLLLPSVTWAIDEFPLPPGTAPGGITTGPDGAVWFVAEGTSRIHRITPTGVLEPTDGFTVPISGSDTTKSTLDQIVVGPDGALWFTEPRDSQIGRVTTTGNVTEYTVPLDGAPEGITAGPDGALWFTASGIGKIGRIPANPPATPPHGIVLYPSTGVAGSGLSDITAGPDGALWFTESTGNQIGRMTTAGALTQPYVVPTPSSEPAAITPGPGGGLWFTESAAGQIAQLTIGAVTPIVEYPGAGAAPSAIAVGRDGALWFTESDLSAGAIGRITTGGVITNHFPVPTAGSEPSDITAGPDGALWFTEFLGDRVGRIDTAPPYVPPVSPPVTPAPVAPVRKPCTVPKVVRLTVAKAKRKLRRAGCKHRVRGRGRVVWTRPRAGRRTFKTVRVMAKPRKRSR